MSRSKKTVIFITTNSDKVRELQALAEDITIRHINYDYPELQLEEIEAIVCASAKYIREEESAGIGIEDSFFIEDTGLYIPALNGFPGPFSAFIFRSIGNEGILRLMSGKKGEEREATFKTVIAFCDSAQRSPVLFAGTVTGNIAEKIRGNSGFGYDPIFEVESSGKRMTLAEMSMDEKNTVSHRSRAFRKLMDYLSQYNNSAAAPVVYGQGQ